MSTIETIRDYHPARVYVAATGAGAGIQTALWAVPGASKFLVGATFPYGQEATTDFLGFEPEKYASVETAMDLAMESYRHAWKPGLKDELTVGVGLTASVASTEAHRGDHRVHAAYFSDRGAFTYTYTLPKGQGYEQRIQDGRLADIIGLRTLFAAFGMFLPSPVLEPMVGPAEKDAGVLAEERLFAHPLFLRDGKRGRGDIEAKAALFPGAFNPPHEGHFGIAEEVRSNWSKPVVFTTTIDPPHKEALSVSEVLRRSCLFRGKGDILFTKGDPLYIDKASRFPRRTFVIGADALIRMFDPKWCSDPVALLDAFRQKETRFYVSPRMVEGRITGLGDLLFNRKEIKLAGFGDLCTPLHGHWDISSSDIRARMTREAETA